MQVQQYKCITIQSLHSDTVFHEHSDTVFHEHESETRMNVRERMCTQRSEVQTNVDEWL